MTTPLVTIGMPVYNGETLVGRSIESLLAQDYPNIEIIISDNASTDGTQAICLGFAKSDSRIRYTRQPENRGAIENFNRLIDSARGEYFMWAAHDDLRDGGFVSACVAQLQANPQAVLCQSHTQVLLDSTGELLCLNTLDTFERQANVFRRYWVTLTQFPMTAIYGLYRTAAIRKTARLTRSIASDVSFVRELSLYGEFTQVRRPLFTYRIRDRWNDVHQDYRAFTGKPRKPIWYLPFLVLFANDLRRVVRSCQPLAGKFLLTALLCAALLAEKSKRVMVMGTRVLVHGERRSELAVRMYWGLFHNPNVEVVSPSSYRDRVIEPIVLP